MSIALIRAVLEHELAPADPGRRLVLLLLAYFANDDGTEARPGLELLSRRAAMVPRSVLRHLAALEAAGWIVRDRTSAPGRVTVWRVLNTPIQVTATSPKRAPKHDTKRVPNMTETTRKHDRPSTTTRHDPSKTRHNPPLSPQAAAEVVHAELLPAPAPDGAGRESTELSKGQRLDQLIAAVKERRQPPLTRPQAVAARNLARECLEAGWDPGLIVAALAVTSAFTMNALTFAVDQLRRQVVGDPQSRLTPFEQTQMRRRPR
jgi:hypothetical protein